MALRSVVASVALAAVSVQAQRINGEEVDCPDNWSFGSINDETFCCFGSSRIVNGDGSCCVGAVGEAVDFDDCFPFCDDDEDEGVNVATPSCATEIPYTASNYMSLVSAASRSVMSDSASATDESSSSPATTTAEPTNSGSSDDDDDNDDDDDSTGDDGDDGDNSSTGDDGDDSSNNGDGGDGNQTSTSSGGDGGDGGDGSNEGGSNESDESDEGGDDNAGSALTGHAAVKFGAVFAIAALLAL